MNARQRAVWLTLALAGTVLAAWFAPDEEQVPAPARAPAPPVAGALERPAAAVRVLRILPREQGADDEVGFFGAARAAVTPVVANVAPAPVAAAAPMPPSAPPVPFRAIGRFTEGGREVVFLQYNDRTLLVRAGDTVLDQYRVERLDGRSLYLLYLPLNQQQTLELGSAN